MKWLGRGMLLEWERDREMVRSAVKRRSLPLPHSTIDNTVLSKVTIFPQKHYWMIRRDGCTSVSLYRSVSVREMTRIGNDFAYDLSKNFGMSGWFWETVIASPLALINQYIHNFLHRATLSSETPTPWKNTIWEDSSFISAARHLNPSQSLCNLLVSQGKSSPLCRGLNMVDARCGPNTQHRQITYRPL